ncbi:putative uncharacterized protein [Clostridium sp. CAG:632]|jgi:hypothetical protein|nr:putative uncharacterized protein [Clostridium sp. CAG:632]
MDIPALSIAMSTERVQRDWSLALMSKTLDTMETNGDALAKLMESSVTPNLGQNIDIRL